MSAILHDLRHAFRVLLRQRTFTFLALTTLALGIGANSAIFAVVNAVLLRPLPYQDPARIVLIEEGFKKLSPVGGTVTPSDLAEYQSASTAFESVAGYTLTSFEATGPGAPERLDALRVSPEIFSVLGVTPLLGRGFDPSQDRPDNGVALIDDRLWRRRFGGDPAVVGRTVDLDRKPTVIVGVLPRCGISAPRAPLRPPLRSLGSVGDHRSGAGDRRQLRLRRNRSAETSSEHGSGASRCARGGAADL